MPAACAACSWSLTWGSCAWERKHQAPLRSLSGMLLQAGGNVAKQGLAAAGQGLGVAKQAYSKAAPVLKEAADAAAPVVKTAADTVQAVARPALDAVEPTLKVGSVPVQCGREAWWVWLPQKAQQDVNAMPWAPAVRSDLHLQL